MTLGKNRLGQNSRSSRIESLERRTLLSADGLCPVEPADDPAVSGPIEPGDLVPNPTLFEESEGGIWRLDRRGDVDASIRYLR